MSSVGRMSAGAHRASQQDQDGYGQNASPYRRQDSTRSMSGQTALDGYKGDLANGFQDDRPRYNPLNSKRPQSSKLLNIDDPIQVHLLVETALGDSNEFEILSPEEVDELKKQVKTLEQRIIQSKQNLAVQSKYRDAAISMVKLYSPRSSVASNKKPRTSILGSRHGPSPSFDQADQERAASEKRCQDLALELWTLEKTLMTPQRRLLQHTAGILQMTHRGPARITKTNGNGDMPGSPESMYTYTNARMSLDAVGDEDVFDERSLYRSFDRLDGFTLGGRPGSSNGLQASSSEHLNSILRTEQKLKDLNTRLRDVIVKARPNRSSTFEQPPNGDDRRMSAAPGKLLSSQLGYLEQGLHTIDQDLDQVTSERQTQRNKDIELEETVEDINRHLGSLLVSFDPSRPIPPELTGKHPERQIAYLEDSIPILASSLQQAASFQNELESTRNDHAALRATHETTSQELDAARFAAETSQNALARANSTRTKNVSQAEEFEITLSGLWDIIQSEEEHLRQQKLQRRQNRELDDPAEQESDSDEDANTSVEPFSLQAFSAKVQSIFFQTTSLKDHKKVLTRQINQQRELNSKDNAELAQKLTQNEQALAVAEKETSTLQAQLVTVMQQLDKSRRESTQRGLEQARKENEESTTVVELQAKLEKSTAQLAQLEAELQLHKDDQSINQTETQAHLAEYEAEISTLTTQLEEAEAHKVAAVEAESRLKSKESEMDEMNMQIATLQTEVTIAKAELDGAYGSRAQRAANVAQNPAIQKEIDELTAKNLGLLNTLSEYQDKATTAAAASSGSTERAKQLQKELEETITEYELMTKASIEWEREREDLEAEIDRMRDEREDLEAKLSDEQVRWLGMKSPGAESMGAALKSPGFGAMSTAVMKEEFKKMMRDARAEATKALRAEQMERRRIEEQFRALKKAQKSSKLDQSQEGVSS